MAERRPFGEAGRAARVLDVDRVIERELGRAPVDRAGVDRRRSRGELLPLLGFEEDHTLELHEIPAYFVDDGAVVTGLEARRGDEHAAARLLEHVRELVATVRRVDVDEDHADLGGRVLEDHPLRVVRAPDADPVTSVETGREQRPRDPVDLEPELAIRVAHALERDDERLAIGEAGHGSVEVRADRLAEEGLRSRPGCVRDRHGVSLWVLTDHAQARSPDTSCRRSGRIT